MNLESMFLFRYIALVSVAIYFAFDYIDGRRVRDEREDLIRLKTFELLQKLVLASLTGLSVLFFFYPAMPAIFPIMVLVMASMYGEIAGKIYYRRKF